MNRATGKKAESYTGSTTAFSGIGKFAIGPNQR